MENAWHLFLGQLGSPDPEFTYDDVCGWSADEFEALTAIELISEIARAAHVVCDACPMGHWERVRWSEDGERASIPCPSAGNVEVNPERLRRWRANAGRLSNFLSTAIAPPGKVQPLPASQIWFLGRRVVGGFTPYFFFAATRPDQLSSATEAVQAAYGRVNAVLLVPFSPPNPQADTKVRIVDLATLTALEDRRIAIDLSLIEAQFGGEESPKNLLTKRPPKSLKDHRMSILRAYMPTAGIQDMNGLAASLRIDRSVIYGIVREDRLKYGESTLSAMLLKIGCSRAVWDSVPKPINRS